jgi:4-amino-4-deoxy-L-arabinose transferase-like glycosyltransferase
VTARHELAVLIAACAALYLTGIGDVPFYTRGEPREGLVVRQMVRSGDWLVPARPGGDPARKPPLYYWAAAAALTTLPEPPERALRLPSGLLGTAGVLVVWAAARAALPAGAALPAALVLATTFEWTRAATSARVDMALAAPLAVLLAAWIGVLVAPAGRRRTALLAVGAAAAALGTLGKGPVALVLPALAAGALWATRAHRAAARTLRPAATLGAAAAVAGAWYAAAFAHEGWAFVDVVTRENLLRFLDTETAETGHAHGPAYLLLVGLVGLLPWTPLAPLALAAARSAATALAAAWAVCGLVFLSLATAKRSVYLLPLYPAVALLLAGGLAAPPTRRPARVAWWAAHAYPLAFAAAAATATAIAAGVDVGAPIRPLLKPPDAAGARALAAAAADAAPAVLLVAGATAVAAALAWRALRALAWSRLVLVVAATFVVWTAFFDGVLHPAIGRDRSVRAFLAHVGTIVPPDATLRARFPPDPAVRFYAPRELQPWPDAGGTGGYALLWEDEWRALRDARGEPLPVVAVSDARRTRRGHLALVRVPAGPVAPAR